MLDPSSIKVSTANVSRIRYRDKIASNNIWVDRNMMITMTLGKRSIAAIAVLVLIAAGYIVGTYYLKNPVPSQTGTYSETPAPQLVSQENRAAQQGAPQTAPLAPSGKAGSTGGVGQQYQIPPRKVVYTASMTLEVEDVEAAVNAVYGIAAKYGGYVGDANYHKKGVESAEVTIKIPVDSYRQALDDLRGIGELKSFSEKAQDVTDYYMDLEARLRNLRAEEERLLEYLDKAKTISEILQVEDHLARIRGQIEWLEAQLKNLERRIDYATISVTIASKHKPEELIEWPELNLLKIIRDAVGMAIAVIAGLLIILVGLAPIYIPATIIYVVYKKRKSRKQAEPPQPSQNTQ